MAYYGYQGSNLLSGVVHRLVSKFSFSFLFIALLTLKDMDKATMDRATIRIIIHNALRTAALLVMDRDTILSKDTTVTDNQCMEAVIMEVLETLLARKFEISKEGLEVLGVLEVLEVLEVDTVAVTTMDIADGEVLPHGGLR